MIYFSEKQRFRQWWLWALLGAVFLDMLYVSFIAHRPAHANDWAATLLGTSALIACIALIAFIRLDTLIKDDGIYARLSPFHRSYRFYPWEALSQCYVRTYKPILEYGGWGLRFGGLENKAYNISGNQGLQLKLKDGEKVLIGTRKAEEIGKILIELDHWLAPENANVKGS